MFLFYWQCSLSSGAPFDVVLQICWLSYFPLLPLGWIKMVRRPFPNVLQRQRPFVYLFLPTFAAFWFCMWLSMVSSPLCLVPTDSLVLLHSWNCLVVLSSLASLLYLCLSAGAFVIWKLIGAFLLPAIFYFLFYSYGMLFKCRSSVSSVTAHAACIIVVNFSVGSSISDFCF